MSAKKSATGKLLKVLGIIVVIIIVGGIAAKAMGWLDGGEPEKVVETENAERRTITQIVSASGRIQPEEEVIIRPDVSGEIIELAVNEGDFVRENDIVNVTVDDTSDIEVDAYPNRIFKGVVTEIANSAEITGQGSAEQVTNYMVKIRIMTPHNLEQSGDEMVAMQVNESPDREFILNFKPGMSATVDILTNTVVDVVSIPIQAVTVWDFAKVNTPAQSDTTESENSEDTDSSGNTTGTNEDFRRVVFINENGVAKRDQVETGISDNSYIQVLSGLDAGDEVVTDSYRILSRELSDGDPLKTEKNNAVADRGGS